jgi:hypothetical protein
MSALWRSSPSVLELRSDDHERPVRTTYQSSDKNDQMTATSPKRTLVRSLLMHPQRTAAMSPKRSFDLRIRETRLREESTFAAGAKALRQFSQTGHSTRNGEN